jgi:hypothetical protein
VPVIHRDLLFAVLWEEHVAGAEVDADGYVLTLERYADRLHRLPVSDAARAGEPLDVLVRRFREPYASDWDFIVEGARTGSTYGVLELRHEEPAFARAPLEAFGVALHVGLNGPLWTSRGMLERRARTWPQLVSWVARHADGMPEALRLGSDPAPVRARAGTPSP